MVNISRTHPSSASLSTQQRKAVTDRNHNFHVPNHAQKNSPSDSSEDSESVGDRGEF